MDTEKEDLQAVDSETPCSDAITREWLGQYFGAAEKSPGGCIFWDKEIDESEGSRVWIRAHEPDSWDQWGLEIYSDSQCSDGVLSNGVLLGYFDTCEQVFTLVEMIRSGYSDPEKPRGVPLRDAIEASAR